MALESLIYFVCSIGVGGTLLALAGLAIELRLGKQWGQRLSASSAVVLAVIAAASAAAGAPVALWGSMATLAAVASLAWASRVRLVRHWLVRLCNANTVWLILLIAAPAVTWWLISEALSPPPLEIGGFPAELVLGASVEHKDHATIHGRTDRGSLIPLFAFETAYPLEDMEAATLTTRQYAHQIIQIEEPNGRSNCHGWVFTDGRFGVHGGHVETILADNGYHQVEKPQENDVVVYRSPEGQVDHTGVVQLVTDEGLVLVESKWGPLGVFLHPLAVQPYGDRSTFYRSARRNHLLAIVDGQPDDAKDTLEGEEAWAEDFQLDVNLTSSDAP